MRLTIYTAVTLVPILLLLLFVPGLPFLGAQDGDDGTGPGDPADIDPGRVTLDSLAEAYPGIHVSSEGRGIVTVSGRPMTAAATPQAAADNWLARWSAALGFEELDLQLERSHGVAHNRLTVLAYSQTIQEHPVVGSAVRILVADGSPCRVVHVATRLTRPPVDGFPPIATTPGQVLSSTRATDSFGQLTEWGQPRLVVLGSDSGVDLEDPVLAWSFTGASKNRAHPEAYTFFVDSHDGTLVHLRDEVYEADIQGKLTGKATPGTLPDTAYNPPTTVDIENAEARVVGGNSARSDASGDFQISHAGSSPVTVQADLTGSWVRVQNDAGGELLLSQSVTPPGPADFEFNSAPDELSTSQVNGFARATETHDFFRDRLPSFTGFDIQIPCNVNLASNCNAYYYSLDHSINFFTEGGGCVNTAYSSVVSHEYGHFAVNRLGLSQGAFGEGFGDVVSILLYDDPVVGRDFAGPGSYVRDTVTANLQYPCSGQIHYCGQLLSGCWWDIREALVATHGASAGLEIARQLFADWSVITIGGSGNNSAHPTTAIEVLTVDDDDSDLSNGTPNYADICAAFDAHGIDCPDLSPVLFSYPDGLPTSFDQSVENTFRVHVEANQANPVADSGTITCRVNDGDWTTLPMVQEDPHEYIAAISGLDCFDSVEFYVSVDLVAGGSATHPTDAPGEAHAASTVNGELTVFSDGFETDKAWTVVNDSVSGGAWERGDPAGDGSRGDPTSDFDGSGGCFLTENVAGNSDVDGGPTILTSPTMDFSPGDGTVRYAYWMYNDDGDDTLEVSVRSDGSDWVVVATHTGGNGGWSTNTIRVGEHVAPSATVQIRFQIADTPNNSITEAAIDAIVATVQTCDDLVDCNNNGIPDDEDIGNGSSDDCNNNAVPDECDIESGFSQDVNGNGVPDECDATILFCGVGAVNDGCGPVEEVLLINGSTGGSDRVVDVGPETPVSFIIGEPSSRNGDGRTSRICVYLWDVEPTQSDLVLLPRNLGPMCFGPEVIATAPPELIFNSLGAPGRLGEHNGPGDPPQIPDGGTTTFLLWPEGYGDVRTFTVQGLVQDDCSRGSKNLSTTNGIILRID